MVILDACSLCGGMGFLRIYAGEGQGSARCPACRGTGLVEPWRQSAGPGQEAWRCGGSRRRDDSEIRLVLRVRAEREFQRTNP